jgi:hypothetical protein
MMLLSLASELHRRDCDQVYIKDSSGGDTPSHLPAGVWASHAPLAMDLTVQLQPVTLLERALPVVDNWAGRLESRQGPPNTVEVTLLGPDGRVQKKVQLPEED